MADNESPISPMVERRPELTITPAAVNDQPAELDSTPTSADRIRAIKRGESHEGPSLEDQEKREKLMSERKGDKGVLVDISTNEPSVEELETTEDAAKSTVNNT